MKIKREIRGELVEIELTETELYNAYEEQQFLFDKQDVLDLISGWRESDVVDTFGVDIKTYESYAEDIACEMRRNINKYDMDWDAARDEAVRYVIHSRKRIEQYKYEKRCS